MDLFNQIGKMTSDLANGIVKETGKVLMMQGKLQEMLRIILQE